MESGTRITSGTALVTKQQEQDNHNSDIMNISRLKESRFHQRQVTITPLQQRHIRPSPLLQS